MTKPLTCPKCEHRNSEHELRWMEPPDLEEDVIVCLVCDCTNFNTTDDNLRGIKHGTHRYCSVDGCTNVQQSKELCGLHYTRFRLHGATNTVLENSGRFKKGQNPWNKNLKGIHLSPDTEFQKGDFADNNHMFWKGDEAGYTAKHQWIHRKFGKASQCVHCGIEDAKRYEWANVSGEYKRNIDDWLELCKSCHIKYDGSAYKAWETRRVRA